MSASDDSQVCAVCGRVLDRYQLPGAEWQWAHQLSDIVDGEDHPAVPALPGEVQTRGRCDFCSSDLDPTDHFIVPAASFIVEPLVELVVDGVGMDHASVGDWSACPPCAELVTAGRWSALVRRCCAEFARIYGLPSVPDEVRQHMGRMYLTLRQHIIGPVRPVTGGGPTR